MIAIFVEYTRLERGCARQLPSAEERVHLEQLRSQGRYAASRRFSHWAQICVVLRYCTMVQYSVLYKFVIFEFSLRPFLYSSRYRGRGKVARNRTASRLLPAVVEDELARGGPRTAHPLRKVRHHRGSADVSPRHE